MVKKKDNDIPPEETSANDGLEQESTPEETSANDGLEQESTPEETSAEPEKEIKSVKRKISNVELSAKLHFLSCDFRALKDRNLMAAKLKDLLEKL